MTKKLNGLKVLIVEDEEMLREIFTEEFLDFGAEVQTASSGNEAWALIEKSQFDVIVSDIKMPGGDGVSLARKVMAQSSRPQPKFFLCSGYADHLDFDPQKLGVHKIFNKPFKMDYFFETIFAAVDEVRSSEIEPL